ncbi:MAG: antibiotic ABC transporter permease [Parvimonas sp.]|uniref:antibiotic ABC transporter permease n=1 Tax=Parvimonas sp. TaxID=1944660 RepID=UPI0025F0E171|nr:antibiotic ABC transporter permease [Parvimonas sp.]MCI5997318.1 antibiotic ABC transporter permease [Parvimonas sp.]
MIREFFCEFKRNLAELNKYKFNLIFANLQIFILAYMLTKYFFADNKEIIFLLLIIWYFSTHGLSIPTYIVEEEILDRTLLSILQSETGVLKVVILRCVNTFFIDIIKAVPVFTFLYFVGNFDKSVFEYGFIKLTVIIMSVFYSYSVGIFLSSFVFVFKRFSSFISLTYYYILFFGGITSIIENKILFFTTKLLLPYINARIIFENLLSNKISVIVICYLILQIFVMSLLAYLLFSNLLRKSIEKGDLYGI